jgi:hypothetical protein
LSVKVRLDPGFLCRMRPVWMRLLEVTWSDSEIGVPHSAVLSRRQLR